MLIETLSAELERNFELDGLMNLSRTALGFEPSEIGGTAAKGSFARALAKHCVDVDAVDALLDALALKQRSLSEPLASLRENGIEYEKRFENGDELGGYTIIAELGIGPWATCYRARKEGGDFR